MQDESLENWHMLNDLHIFFPSYTPVRLWKYVRTKYAWNITHVMKDRD